MARTTPTEAVSAFLDPLQRAVACITRTPLIGSGYRPPDGPHFASFAPRGRPIRLRGHRDLRFAVAYGYEVVVVGRRAWEARATRYVVQVMDADERELLAYHWHPFGPSWASFPHLHLGDPIAAPDFAKAHVPTGFIPLAAIARLLIVDLGVEPIRPDWQAILTVPSVGDPP